MGAGMSETSFEQLIQMVRQGNEMAAEELVRAYEPHIRRVVRVQLEDPELRKAIDSMDICQSVLASFFLRAAMGQYEINAPAQLIQLLSAMTRNKLCDWHRKQWAARRDRRRERPLEELDVYEDTSNNSPSQVVAAKELLQQALGLLSDAERQLAMQWAAGETWEDLAKDTGKSPDALRMQVRRSLDRVARQLGVDE